MKNTEKIRICIVEDEEAYVELLQDEIDQNDDMILVRHYYSAIQALENLPNDRPNVVLMDIDLKEEITGIECMFKVKDKIPETNFIMFTVFGDNDRLFNALKSGANGYVLKKDFDTIIPSIRDIISGGSPMSKEIARKVTRSFRKPHVDLLSKLTEREMEILKKISQGFQNKEIGNLLFLTEGGVKGHAFRIYKKLQVNSRMEAMQKYWGK